MEKSRRKVVIINAQKGFKAYYQMLVYYAVKNLMKYIESGKKNNFSSMKKKLEGKREQTWINVGGQLLSEKNTDQIRKDIGSGRLKTWEQIHQRYDDLWARYTLEKQRHAFATLCIILGTANPSKQQWISALEKAKQIQESIRDQVYISRKKDYDNPFSRATYRNLEEMTAAIGTIDDNSFVKQVREETKTFAKRIDSIKRRG